MRYESVHLEAFGCALPEEVVSSEALEHRTDALYERLGLSVGRLELISGIRTRRFWPPGTRPSAVAAAAGRDAIERSGVDLTRIGCLVHASVCRDFMEPATASVVHGELGLPATCQAFDLSNACLGFANAMTVVADKIECGEIQAGLVVAGEDGRALVDETVRMLNSDARVGRKEMKAAYASLTIGSGAAALVLTSASISRVGRRLVGGTVRAATEHVELCSGGVHESGSGPLMDTDSEALLLAGNALALSTWEQFVADFGWDASSIDRIVTHQVGSAHKRLLFETLGLDHAKDFTTVEEYGNIGSVSLPLTFALAQRAGFIQDGHKVVMQGIGSGLHCLMLAVQC